MIFEVSYYSKEKEKEINQLVGKPFSILSRIKMRGNGSQRLQVVEANSELQQLIDRQNTPPYTNIELRPHGIILWFRIKLDNYILVLPYRQLSIYKTDDLFSLHSGVWKVKLRPANQSKLDHRFLAKLLSAKAENQSSYLPDNSG